MLTRCHFVVVVLLTFALGACKGTSEDSKSRLGESCARTEDCAGGARCVDQKCVPDGAKVASRETAASPEAFSKSLVAALMSPDSTALATLIISSEDVDELANMVPADQKEKFLRKQAPDLRGLSGKSMEMHDKAKQTAKRVGADPSDLEYVGVAKGTVKTVDGMDIVKPDLVILVRSRGQEYLLQVESCVRVSRGWVIMHESVFFYRSEP